MTRRFLFTAGVAGTNVAVANVAGAKAADKKDVMPDATANHSSSENCSSLPKVLLLGTMGCHLCEKTHKALSVELQGRCDMEYFDIAECKSEEDVSGLIESVGTKIPVIMFSGRRFTKLKEEEGDPVGGVIADIIARNTRLNPQDLHQISGVWYSGLGNKLLNGVVLES